MSDAAGRGAARRRDRPITFEEVLRRNSVERMKQEKHPFDLLDEFPQLIAMPYEAIPEEDILRLQWHGLYHDKPKVGYFMMRVKIPNGILTPRKLRVIGDLSVRLGENFAELTTRQCIQLHYMKLEYIPDIFRLFEQEGLTTSGACGDILRNITGCPVAGLDAEEYFDVRPVVQQAADFFYGNRDYANLPRKHKHTISACAYHCNAPEIHDVALVGVKDGERVGFTVWVGGGLSTVPRIAKPLGVFIEPSEGLEVLRAIVDTWSNNLRYRMSRVKARFKFMVDDYGPEAIREMVEERLGRKLPDFTGEAKPIGRTDHMGVHEQKQPGLYYIGFPVFPGTLRGDQLLQIADLAESVGGDIRLTREQNLILTGVPEARVDGVIAAMKDIGLTLDVNPIRGTSIGCTGQPYCNYAVGDTKPKVVEIVEHLEARFGEQVKDLHVHLDGCPHACGQHWVGDIGIQGTTKTTPEGKMQAYDIILRGRLGPDAKIGRAVMRRVLSEELKYRVEGLVRAYLEQRESPEETLPAFCERHTDEELIAFMGGETELEPAAVGA
ncbi:MAG TPA: nitrite/sulfite reductase [Limnochordia bacterium]